MGFFGEVIFGKRGKKKEIPSGLWLKCPGCEKAGGDAMLNRKELENNLHVCGNCGHHFRIDRTARIAQITDDGLIEEWDANLSSVDVLKFQGVDSYEAKIKKNQEKTGELDAITCGLAKIDDVKVALGVMDFSFLGASMGAVVGEKVTRLIERATERKLPVILVCASGGARMYEGLFSLMQMAKTSAALARHADARLLYIPVLTHPTTAGVMASFATLGDLIIAEPDALIGFAGPRVIKETTQQDLPDGFQRSEFLRDHGLIDIVVPRSELKGTITTAIAFTRNNRRRRTRPRASESPQVTG